MSIPKFLPRGYETWITSEHEYDLSVTPFGDGYKVTLWSSEGKAFSSVILDPRNFSALTLAPATAGDDE
jgi:hypothetical protein